MTAPRWWVLLLLSAVFGMHGVQCTGADSSMPMPHAAVAATSSSPGHGGVTSEVTPVQAAVLPADEPGSSVLSAAVETAGHSSPAGLMDHLWVVCLAVLAAGLAALVLLLSRVRPGLRTVFRHRAHRRLGSLDPPRPPDIHSLCVLRT